MTAGFARSHLLNSASWDPVDARRPCIVRRFLLRFKGVTLRISRLLAFGALASTVAISACSGGGSSTTPVPRPPSKSSTKLDIGKLFVVPASGRTINAAEKDIRKKLASGGASYERYILLQSNAFTQSTTATYFTSGSTCIPAGAAYVPGVNDQNNGLNSAEVGLYDPTTGELKLNVGGTGTFVPVSGPGAAGQPANDTAKFCFKDSDLIPPVELKGGVTYTVLLYQDFFTNLFGINFSNYQYNDTANNAYGVNGGYNRPNTGSNQPSIAEYPDLSYRFFAPGVTVGSFTNPAQFGFDITNGVAPIANSYGSFGSPRIELRLVGADGTPVLAAIDSSRCTGNPTSSAVTTYSATYCDIYAVGGPAGSGTLYSHLTNDFQTAFSTFKFAKPPLGKSPVQLVIDPFAANNGTTAPSNTAAAPRYQFLRVYLGV